MDCLVTHRVFAFMGGFYSVLIGSFEVLALLVIVSVVVFWIRRNILRIQRFWKPEMKGWPRNDANIILYIETVLMVLFLTMNAADYTLQYMPGAPEGHHYVQAGAFPISQFIAATLRGYGFNSLVMVERTAWWLHIIGILIFLNYALFFKAFTYFIGLPKIPFSPVLRLREK